MPDVTQTVNEALVDLKERTIDSLDAGTELSNRCRLIYPTARDMALELHPWNFAACQAALIASAITPVCLWQYQYPLPTGTGLDVPPYCLVVRGTDLDPDGPPWDVGTHPTDGRVLWSNEASVKIRYTGRIEDLNLWSGLAHQVLVKLLAHKLAPTKAKADEKFQEAVALLPEAKRRDGREGSPVRLRANGALVAARRQVGWGGAYIGIKTHLFD